MAYTTRFLAREPSRAEIDARAGLTLLEFGTPWCGFCTAAQPAIESALQAHAGVEHLKVEDGRGRPLGRSFGVKLWPTLVLMRQGEELGRLVRPSGADAIANLLATPADSA